MILGVGDGTFVILLVTVVGIIVTFVGSYVWPRFSVPIGLTCLSLPFIVYGCIVFSSSSTLPPPCPPSSYRERHFSVNEPGSVVVDYLFPVRVTLLVVLQVVLIVAFVYYGLLSVVWEPPHKAPRVRCLRESLEELHPTWYR